MRQLREKATARELAERRRTVLHAASAWLDSTVIDAEPYIAAGAPWCEGTIIDAEPYIVIERVRAHVEAWLCTTWDRLHRAVRARPHAIALAVAFVMSVVNPLTIQMLETTHASMSTDLSAEAVDPALIAVVPVELAPAPVLSTAPVEKAPRASSGRARRGGCRGRACVR